MAFNPLLAESDDKTLIPHPVPREILLLRRKAIAFELKVGSRKYTGNGFLFLSNKRLVFLKKGKISDHKYFSSFEFPLHLITTYNFKQPIFGANYFEGTVLPFPAYSTAIEQEGQWKLTFSQGSCTTFMRIFFPLVEQMTSAGKAIASNTLLTHGFTRSDEGAAFMDPNDPTTLYFSQPQISGPPVRYNNPSAGVPLLPTSAFEEPRSINTAHSSVNRYYSDPYSSSPTPSSPYPPNHSSERYSGVRYDDYR